MKLCVDEVFVLFCFVFVYGNYRTVVFCCGFVQEDGGATVRMFVGVCVFCCFRQARLNGMGGKGGMMTTCCF